MTPKSRLFAVSAGLAALALASGGVLYAQLEGADRGIAPLDSTSSLEVENISVDATGKTAEEARFNGWKQAQLLGWKTLWASTTNRPVSQTPGLSDSVLNGIVSGIVVQEEQIGPRRYVAKLGVLFDRARTGEMLGIGGIKRRSAPMLTVPLIQTGGSEYAFEFRNPWQAAWARFRTGNSAIDYVRTSGGGSDPLLLNAAQTGRPGRRWWRMIVDQYGAADVIMPEVRLKRSFPGGPAIGEFYAWFGPDKKLLGRFTLHVSNSSGIPLMFGTAVRRLDEIYTRALSAGLLRADPSLIVEEPMPIEELEKAVPEAQASTANVPSAATAATPVYTLQIATPDDAAITAAEINVSGVGGVTSAFTTSRNPGGTSIMRVTYNGDPQAFAAGLRAKGWRVGGSGSRLSISRGGD